MSKANSSRIKEAAQRRYIVQISHDCCHLAIHFRRVLDDASRQRRARKALENLEQVRNIFSSCSFLFSHLPQALDLHMCVNFLIMQDNNCDDPHADLVMSKKALSLFQEEEEHGQRKTKRKVIVFPTLFRKILLF